MKLKFNFVYFFLKFLCLIPFALNFKTLKTHFSVKSILWCVIFSAVLIIVDPHLVNLAYTNLNYNSGTTSGLVEKVLDKGTHCMVLICVYWSIFNIKLIFKIIKLLKNIFEKLNKFQFNFSESLIWKSFAIKFSATQISLIVIHHVYYIFVCDGSLVGILVYTPITTIKYMIGSAMLIKFNLFLIVLKIGFSKTNNAIHKALINRRNGVSINLDCEISDTIDELAEIHFKLCETSYLISKEFSIFGYLVIESQLFRIFMNFAYENRDGILGILCTLAWGLTRVIELVILLYDGKIVVEKVNCDFRV